jgi:hypothetical protein
MLSRLFAIIAVSFTPGCGSVTTSTAFAPSSLLGIWEVVACESIFPHRAGSPASIPNDKYCFGSHKAYPELPADASNDSEDGSGHYYVVGKDILVIRTGVPGGLYSLQLASVNPEQIVWHRGELRVTLRRIARFWDGCNAPKLRSRDVPISYPARS